MPRTLYEVLGVAPESSTEEVRQAYYRLARVLHPDRLDGRSEPEVDRAARRMQEVNEAWRVLQRPDTRSAYDRTLATARQPPPPTDVPSGPGGWGPDDADTDDYLDRPIETRRAEPGDIGLSIVRALPWVVMLIVLGAIFVFTAFAGGADDEEPASTDLMGACVVGSGSGLAEVSCDVPNDGRVVAVVDEASQCPGGTSARSSAHGWLCLRSTATGGPPPGS